MSIADLLAQASAFVQRSPNFSSFAGTLNQKYAVSLEETASAYDALFKSCLRVNAGRDASLRLASTKFDIDDGDRWTGQKKTFIKLIILSEENPIARIEKISATHPYRTMEALHDILFYSTWDNVRVLFQPSRYNVHPGSSLRDIFHTNCRAEELIKIRRCIRSRIVQETSAPCRVYMRSKEVRGIRGKIEPIDAFLYLLRRVALYKADFYIEMASIFEAVLVNAENTFLPAFFIEIFMSKVVLLEGKCEKHVDYCTYLLFDKLATVKTEAALEIARWPEYSSESNHSIIKYIRYWHEAKISAYFAINIVYPASYSDDLMADEADEKCNVLFDYFFNEVEIRKEYPRMKELLQDEGLMNRLPDTFYYRVFAVFWKYREISAVGNLCIMESTLYAFPENKWRAVIELAMQHRNIDLLLLLNGRKTAPSALRQNPLI
ncbi:hypothetical protein PAPHI01_1318 [Pancytospora philotis]|nr:hypothetical protein PAPHI01_1318 [Pancytospora philotis]